MPALTIRNVPENVLESLRQRAKLNHRSMQGELMVILESAIGSKGNVTIEEVRRRAQQLGLKTGDDSTRWIREDRDSR